MEPIKNKYLDVFESVYLVIKKEPYEKCRVVYKSLLLGNTLEKFSENAGIRYLIRNNFKTELNDKN